MELYDIVSDIFQLSCHVEVIFFHWISKDKNIVVDSIAKQGLVKGEALMAGT